MPVLVAVARYLPVVALGASHHMPTKHPSPASFYYRHPLELGETQVPLLAHQRAGPYRRNMPAISSLSCSKAHDSTRSLLAGR